MPLEPEDQHHLTVAQGYAELGMFLDADSELEAIDPDVRHVPEVLTVRIQIYSALKKWELMQAVAKKMAQYVIQRHKDIVRQLKARQSIRNAAKITGKGISTVQRVKASAS